MFHSGEVVPRPKARRAASAHLCAGRVLLQQHDSASQEPVLHHQVGLTQVKVPAWTWCQGSACTVRSRSIWTTPPFFPHGASLHHHSGYEMKLSKYNFVTFSFHMSGFTTLWNLCRVPPFSRAQKYFGRLMLPGVINAREGGLKNKNALENKLKLVRGSFPW